MGQQTDSLRCQCGQQSLVIDAVLPLHRLMQQLGELLETLFAERPAVVMRLGSTQVELGAHLEELIQVGRDDAQKAQAL